MMVDTNKWPTRYRVSITRISEVYATNEEEAEFRARNIDDSMALGEIVDVEEIVEQKAA
jgi:hypothetical protein